MDNSLNNAPKKTLGHRLLHGLDVTIRVLAVILYLLATFAWGFFVLVSVYLLKKDVGADVDVVQLVLISSIALITGIIVIASAFERTPMFERKAELSNSVIVLTRLPAYLYIPVSYYFVYPYMSGLYS